MLSPIAAPDDGRFGNWSIDYTPLPLRTLQKSSVIFEPRRHRRRIFADQTHGRFAAPFPPNPSRIASHRWWHKAYKKEERREQLGAYTRQQLFEDR